MDAFQNAVRLGVKEKDLGLYTQVCCKSRHVCLYVYVFEIREEREKKRERERRVDMEGL